ncbi:DUF294 nucleotidyltransferase-like domain-containing protein [Nostocoides australiense]
MALDVELAEIRDFLAAQEPFADLPQEALTRLVPRLTVEYHRRGTAIMTPGRDSVHLYVVRSGAVDMRDAIGTLVDRGEVGDCFGSTTLLGGNPSTFSVVAIEDTLTLAMGAATFAELCNDHREFGEFFDAQRTRRMAGAVAAKQASASGSAILKTRMSELARKAPITVSVHANVREAAQVMSDAGVSSLLVMDGERLAGIITDRDLRNRVLAAGRDGTTPLAEVMSANPVTARADGLAFEAMLEMVARNIHHLPLMDGDRAIGVVTTTDLMRLEQANPVYIAGDIAKQKDSAGVAAAAARLPRVVESLVAQDASAADMGRIVTSVGDAVERRLIALAEERLGAPPVPYCWVTLGSRARMEQALAADQDNALIIDDAAQPADLDYFAQIAELVTGWLVEAGYPRCPGDVMATNPKWRITLREWKHVFGEWLNAPVPDAILRASIFFDMRPVAGDAQLYAELDDLVRSQAPSSKRFLSHLAGAAVANEPPVGFFRGFVLEKEGEHAHTLDIKRGGVGAVVDLARVHALALGLPARNTDERIAGAVAAKVMGAARGADLRDAFEFISYVRMSHQAAQVKAGTPPDNHISPDELSSFDKRHLREAFGIVRSAQSTLGTVYGTGKLG